MLPMLDSATKTTRPPRGQPARFKEERAARMDGPHAVHAGVAISHKEHRLFVTSRYDGTLKRLMTACRTLPRYFGTGDQNVPAPLAYAAGGIGCLTDYLPCRLINPPARENPGPVDPRRCWLCAAALAARWLAGERLVPPRRAPDVDGDAVRASFDTRRFRRAGARSSAGGPSL